ncbi:glycosyltransferase family 4 protein [Helicobacter burdigaliensis]|uniref:glycosyltransferase family 4 protein n=1 Tax=Helicobacter burdigaliensis TaxID=2315334 RepID=UPI000EF6E825|nr:glycosyltransferase family 4 protein [Helicobacter burdigaliensis]
MKIIFLSHTDMNLYRFRLPVMEALVKEGHEVIALVPRGDYFTRFLEHKITPLEYKINRGSLNPFREFKTLLNIAKILRQEKPDILHTFMLKPNIYGSIASKIAKIENVINSVTGLGSFYIKEGFKTKLFVAFLEFLNKIAFKKAKKVLFQNEDDLNLYVKKGLLPKNKAILIRGSGVNTQAFYPLNAQEKSTFKQTLDIKEGQLVVLMVARAIVHKGVEEYYKAALKVQEKLKENVVFLFVGGIDKGNIAPISEEFLRENKQVKWLGERGDIRELMGICDVFVLPSYREGIPRTLLEACSMQKAIVTTNAIGCKEVVNDGENGFLVPIGDSEILSQRILELLENEALRENFAKRSRERVCEEFSVEFVVREYLKMYQEVINYV